MLVTIDATHDAMLLQAGLIAYFTGAINMKKSHYNCVQTLNSIEEETGQVGFCELRWCGAHIPCDHFTSILSALCNVILYSCMLLSLL